MRFRLAVAALAALAAGVAMIPIASALPQVAHELSQAAAANPTGVHDFDFLVGEWRVRHRYLRASAEWSETDGTCSTRALMQGEANIEEHVLNAPSGAYRALGLRAYDAKTALWSIWWLDGRDPHGKLDPPLKGRFENGVGTFFVDDTLDGKPVRKRFIWSRITPTAARWEQAFSPDAGKTWETNWIMDFKRLSTTAHSDEAAPGSAQATPSSQAAPTQGLRNPAGLHDFDFLVGEWRVRHRRVRAGSTDWVEFEGTCSNRPLMESYANMEEHRLKASDGAYEAIGLRAYDPKTRRWAIWWLDGRYPSGILDPPVTGGFENGVGTFYSDYMDDGKPMRVRFTWSHMTSTSARWEQASSADGGARWETNWTMEFQRVR